jgi:hypothetical protein
VAVSTASGSRFRPRAELVASWADRRSSKASWSPNRDSGRPRPPARSRPLQRCQSRDKHSGALPDGCYLARLQTSSADPPPDAAAVFHLNSSPETVNGRFCSVPLQFGNELASMWKVRLWSASLTV